MTELSLEHVLILVIVAFVLYHFVGRCNCFNGFNVGAQHHLSQAQQDAIARSMCSNPNCGEPSCNCPDPSFKCMADKGYFDDEIKELEKESEKELEKKKQELEKELEKSRIYRKLEKELKIKKQYLSTDLKIKKQDLQNLQEKAEKNCNDINEEKIPDLGIPYPFGYRAHTCLTEAGCKVNESNKLTCRQFKRIYDKDIRYNACGDRNDPDEAGDLCVSKELKEKYPGDYDKRTCTGYDTEKLDNVVTFDEYRDYKCCN